MKICIVSDEQGIRVGIEPPDGDDAGEDYLQPAASAEEALSMVSEMLSSADSRTPDQAALDGYNKSAPKPGGNASPAAVFGDGM